MNILDIDIKSSFKYQLIFFLSCAIHITFFIMFLADKLYVLVGVNVFSVIFYFSGGLFARTKLFDKHNTAWILSTYIEITAHAVLCTLWIGFESCFFLYAIIALIVSSYVVYLAFDKDTFFKIITPLAITSFVALIICFIFLTLESPIVVLFFHNPLSVDQLQVMRGVNIFINFGAIFLFTLIFIAEMHSLLKKLDETNHKLNYIANHDALTDLYNRHSLKELFVQFKEKFRDPDTKTAANDYSGSESGERDDDSLSYCVIMGDVDNFKSINDTYGHSCGDTVLKQVAAAIKNSVDENEIACRWGGEEFLVLMHGGKEECVRRTEEIRKKVSEIRIEEEKDLSVTVTFGLVYCTEKKDNVVQSKRITKIDELVQIADNRLYTGKSSGKNVVIYQ